MCSLQRGSILRLQIVAVCTTSPLAVTMTMEVIIRVGMVEVVGRGGKGSKENNCSPWHRRHRPTAASGKRVNMLPGRCVKAVSQVKGLWMNWEGEEREKLIQASRAS